MNRTGGYIQLYDGVGVSVRSKRPFRFRCCDCGMTHWFSLVQGKNGWIGFAVQRINRRRKRACK